MSDYDGMDYEELLGEAEWMSDFLSMMAERITNDSDVHNLVDYVRKIEGDNAKLRELVEYMHRCYVRGHDWGPYGAPEKWWVEEQMRELGIEVHHAD